MGIGFKSITENVFVLDDYTVEKKINLDKVKWVKSSIELNVSKALKICIASIILLAFILLFLL